MKLVSRSDVPDYHDGERFDSITRSLVTADVYERSDFDPMGFQTMLKRVKARTYKSERGPKDNFDFICSNFPTYNTTPVPRFHHAHPVDHSHFYTELLGPRSATTRETPSTRGRETVTEHRKSRRTFGPVHPWRPPWTDPGRCSSNLMGSTVIRDHFLALRRHCSRLRNPRSASRLALFRRNRGMFPSRIVLQSFARKTGWACSNCRRGAGCWRDEHRESIEGICPRVCGPGLGGDHSHR